MAVAEERTERMEGFLIVGGQLGSWLARRFVMAGCDVVKASCDGDEGQGQQDWRMVAPSKLGRNRRQTGLVNQWRRESNT